jgi:hypothetical protein
MVVEGGVVGGIGDDVCAIMLTFDLEVSDSDSHPLSEVELWRIDRHHIAGKALRLGVTDATGRLSALDCYMPSLEYRFWSPDTDPVQVQLMLLREGFGVTHLRLSPSTADVLATGNLLGVPPGQSFEWSQVKASHDLKSFHIPVKVALDRAQP